MNQFQVLIFEQNGRLAYATPALSLINAIHSTFALRKAVRDLGNVGDRRHWPGSVRWPLSDTSGGVRGFHARHIVHR